MARMARSHCLVTGIDGLDSMSKWIQRTSKIVFRISRTTPWYMSSPFWTVSMSLCRAILANLQTENVSEECVQTLIRCEEYVASTHIESSLYETSCCFSRLF